MFVRTFLSTPSGWRATTQVVAFVNDFVISIHALRVEGDLRRQLIIDYWPISIHALRVEGDPFPDIPGQFADISIHALRVEGDFWRVADTCAGSIFLSTPSGWRATIACLTPLADDRISIHALRVEGDPR